MSLRIECIKDSTLCRCV